jgi:CBS domain-containing protein
MKQISDIMTTPVIAVKANTLITKVANLMIRNNLTGLPVINDQNQLVGIITEHDFLTREEHIHIPSYLSFLMELGQNRQSPIKNEIKKIQTLTAGDLMTKKVITLKPDDHIVKAAKILTEKKINPLPVVDNGGYLVGIVSRSDIVKLFNIKFNN